MERFWMAIGMLAAAIAAPACAQSRANTLTDCEKRQGFSLLFDGTLDSFRGNFSGYKKDDTSHTPIPVTWTVSAADSALLSAARQADIRSVKTYRDFDLRFEYRNDGDAGIFYRTLPRSDLLMNTGVEYAIQDDVVRYGKKALAGAAYFLFPAAVENYRPYSTGKWNQGRIVVVGDSVEHWLNGSRTVAFRYHSPHFWTAVQEQESKWQNHPLFCLNTPGDFSSGPIPEGYLGIQGDHFGKWTLRSLRVTESPVFGNDENGCVVSEVNRKFQGRANGNVLIKSLRRTGTGAALTLEGDAEGAISAHLVSLDGRVVLKAPVGKDMEAVFHGALAPGAWLAIIPSESGSESRMMILP